MKKEDLKLVRQELLIPLYLKKYLQRMSKAGYGSMSQIIVDALEAHKEVYGKR